MGKYFSDAVDRAIEDIYYCYDSDRAVAALQPLLDAAKAGDGDASYILSRCLSGNCYSWDYHPFREDEEGANFFLRQAIHQGSAAAVLGAMRCGMLTPELEEAMPFENLKEAWEVIRQKAEAGSLFCQYMIGNTYYWCDMLRIEGRGPKDFPTWEECQKYLRQTTLACIPWLEKAFYGGLGFGGRNLYNLYDQGDKDAGIEPQKEKAWEVARRGAELGYPDWQAKYGQLLYHQGEKLTEAVEWMEKAVAQGDLSSCYNLGSAYEEAKGVSRDMEKALEIWEKGAQDEGDQYCCSWLGNLYLKGEQGVPQDPARGVQLLELAVSRGNLWYSQLLACCYLTGNGCQKDYARAKWLLDNTEPKRKTESWYYGMGLMYTQGLGVPEDIKKGVEYLQQSSLPEAKQALLGYKKTFFGKWVRR